MFDHLTLVNTDMSVQIACVANHAMIHIGTPAPMPTEEITAGTPKNMYAHSSFQHVRTKVRTKYSKTKYLPGFVWSDECRLHFHQKVQAGMPDALSIAGTDY